MVVAVVVVRFVHSRARADFLYRYPPHVYPFPPSTCHFYGNTVLYAVHLSSSHTLYARSTFFVIFVFGRSCRAARGSSWCFLTHLHCSQTLVSLTRIHANQFSCSLFCVRVMCAAEQPSGMYIYISGKSPRPS